MIQIIIRRKKYERLFKKESKVVFTVGAVVGAGLTAFLKTKKACELAVKGVANSMILKDKVLENVANIKEESEDICAQAKKVAQENCQ